MPELSPAAWHDVLGPRLVVQQAADQTRRDYYDGKHRLAFATAKFKEAFARFFPPMANNWMQLIVDAAVERLEVQGFSFGSAAGAPSWDWEADDDAWAIWQANNLDELSVVAHTEAIKCGKAYAMVEPREPFPRITIESSLQVTVACAPGDPRTRLAALKRFLGEDGYAYSTLYLPRQIVKFRSVEKPTGSNRLQWKRRGDDPGGKNPLGEVPVIPLENNRDILDGGRSDLDVAIPIQDAVNKLCLDMQVSSEFHAYPQRWATGWEVPKDADGNVDRTRALKASQATVWASEDEETKFGQLTPGEVSNYIEPIELYIDHLAAQTRTPAYYLKGKMANMSADALKAAETGLVYRCKRKTLSFGDGWEEVMRLAFKAKGDDKRANATAAETQWADVESRSLAQVVDAAVKMRESLDVPAEVAWRIMGFSPQEIKQMVAMNGWTPGGPATANGSGDSTRIVLPSGVTGE